MERRETLREPHRGEGASLTTSVFQYSHHVSISTTKHHRYPFGRVHIRCAYVRCLHVCVCVVTEIEWHESGRKGQKRNLDKDLVKCRGMGNCDGYPACTSLSFSLSLATFRSSSSFGGLALDPISPSGSLRSHDHKPSISLHGGKRLGLGLASGGAVSGDVTDLATVLHRDKGFKSVSALMIGCHYRSNLYSRSTSCHHRRHLRLAPRGSLAGRDPRYRSCSTS